MRKNNIMHFMICFLAINLFSFKIYGQLYVKDTPYSFKNSLDYQNTPMIVMEGIDTVGLFFEDIRESSKEIPPRFGVLFPVNITNKNSGEWIELPDGSRLWRLIIECPKAKSINLVYDKFWLPEGAKFFIYNETKNHMIGAFTSLNNIGSKEFPSSYATGLLNDDKIILEYFEPKSRLGEGVISISGIVHGYRLIEVSSKTLESNNGISGSCNINVNCIEGLNWQSEKRGVALIIVDNIRLGTGCLINNSNQDGSPLFLTAYHNLHYGNFDAVTNPNANTWLFMWNYESPNCENINVYNAPVTASATIISNTAPEIEYTSGTDFALLRLTESPLDLPNSVDVTFCGWDRSGVTPTSTVCIHHPNNDIKKISFDFDPPGIVGHYSNGIYPPGTTFWQIFDWDLGVTESGSSGAPLFDQNHRIIGQLYGGSSECGLNKPDYFGRLSKSWNTGSEPKRRLQEWLDPNNTGILFTDGKYCPSVYFESIVLNTNISNCRINLLNTEASNSVNLILDSDSETVIRGSFYVPLGSTLVIQ